MSIYPRVALEATCLAGVLASLTFFAHWVL